MLSIKLARNLGFCTGVSRAINIVEKTLSTEKGKVYSLGAVIHNPRFIQQLEKKNLIIVHSLDELKRGSVLILPSHGSSGDIRKIARKKKLKLVDTTCPYVSSVQKICLRLHRQGFRVVIIGDRDHPEIKALLNFAPGAIIIENAQDVKNASFSDVRIGIISQTTQSKDKFFWLVAKILQKNTQLREGRIFNTICLDTLRRQEEAKKLAEEVEALLIIGSATSANTKRLFSLARKINPATYLIETEDVALNGLLRKAKKIGIISGASAPDELVQKIIKKINGAIT